MQGLLIALDNIDEVIKIIRGSKNVQEAKAELISRFDLSEVQAQAIVDNASACSYRFGKRKTGSGIC